MQKIDNTNLLIQAHYITGAAADLLEKLDEVVKDTPEKVRTYEAIKTIVEAQSNAIRGLVEQHVQISDLLNILIDKNQL